MNKLNDDKKRERKPALAAVAFLCVLAAVVFANTFKNDFVGYDDQNLIVGNQSIRSLSPSGVAHMFLPEHRGNYQPLRTFSYAVDYAIWGMRPFGFQLANIILHALTVIGVWLLARKLTPGPTAFVAALIFAVHPIHVESVTWMSARKDVLCLVFFLAAMLLHENFEEKGKGLSYALSIAATGLALLSKLTAVMIPFCIFLLDICKNGWPPLDELRRKIVRLLPHMFLVCLIIGLNFVRPEVGSSHGDALAGLEGTGQGMTRDIWLSMPLVVCRYIGLLFAPFNLSTHYEVSRISQISDLRVLAPVVLLSGLALAAIAGFLRGKNVLAFSIGWFAITFLPTSNLVPTAAMMTDRYMHIPSVGFSILLAAALLYPASRIQSTDKSSFRMLALLPAIAIVLLLSILTIRRNSDWRDTESLFKRTLLVNPRSVDAQLALGTMKADMGDLDGAIKMYRDALTVSPGHYRILYNLGVTYRKKGWLREATRALEQSRDSNPDFLVTHFNLALAYHEQKRYSEAITEHREVLRLQPNHAPSHGDLGRIYLETGDTDLALTELNRALAIQSNLVPPLIDRAALLMRQGRFEEAERDVLLLESLGVDTGSLRSRLNAVPDKNQLSP
jgi:tetratricopeptide (TPR) repeat protein